MSRFFPYGLRSRALVLVLLAVLPLLALTLYSYLDQRDQAIREVQRSELVVVQNLAIIQETVLSDFRKLLTTLAQLPQVQRRARDACNALFADLLQQSPQSLTIVACDAEGRLFASAPVRSNPVSYKDRHWFQKIIQTRDMVIDQAVLGRISGKNGTNVAYPIVDGEGQFQGAISTQLDLHWLGSLLSRSGLPPATAMILTDSTWKVLFRYPQPQKYIGASLPDFLVKAMAQNDKGEAEGVGLPGDERLFAFARLSPPWQEMRLVIALPRDWAVGTANHALWRNLIWLGLVALFALAAVWYGGNLLVVRPVKQLRVVTERLAAGDLTVRSGSAYTEGELGLLSHSFDQMADALQARQNETARLLGLIQIERDKFRALIGSMSDEVWFVDPRGKITWANPAALGEFGLGPGESIEVDLKDFLGGLEISNADGSPHTIEQAPRCEPLRGKSSVILR